METVPSILRQVHVERKGTRVTSLRSDAKRQRASLVTIRDVARDARVAVSTVSRVLNGSGAASERTRVRVIDAARRLGYQPSGTARSLRKGRTMTIGLLIPDLANPIFVSYLRGAESVAERHGFSVLACDGHDSPDAEVRGLQRFYEHRVDGLLLAGPVPMAALDALCAAGVPIEPFLPGQKQVPLPRAALEEAASLTAFRSLLKLGHRRIAFFARHRSSSSVPSSATEIRRQVLARALSEVGAGDDDSMFVVASPEQCRAEVQRLTALQDPPTAYIAGSHVLAAPLLSAIYDAGLTVPADVSFVSFGDSPWAVAHRPPISVVRFDYSAEASSYMERLIARIEGWPSIPVPEPLPSEFVPRGSVAVPPVG